MWGHARAALAEADEILIIGYSFPRTDQRSNRLFLDAFSRRASVPSVTIIDPVPGRAVDKMRIDFGIPEERLTVIPEPLREEFDFSRILGVA